MKSHAVILALCTLVPCITSAQPGLDKYRSGTSRSMLTLDPQLRIGTVLTPDVDLITMDAGPVLIAPYRPRISFIKPHVMGPQSAILLEPGDNTPHVSFMNTGANGMDGVKVFYGDDFPIGFDITYTVNQGNAKITYEDMTASMTTEKQYMPSLAEELEKIIASGIQNSFEKKYRLNQGEESVKFRDNLNDITIVREYDKATPKLLEKVVSGNVGVDEFFLNSYNLATLSSSSKCGTLTENVVITRIYDKLTPKLTETISSDNAGMDNFFDIEYILDELKTTESGGDLTANVMKTTTYDKATPKIEEKIASENPGIDNFILTSYNLPELSATSKGSNMTENIQFRRTYDISTPLILDRISSDNPGLPSFFDISYRVDELIEMHLAGDMTENVKRSTTYDKSTPKIQEHISSDNMGQESFFDISYDLESGKHIVQYGETDLDILQTTTYDNVAPKILDRIASNNLGQESFFDISYDLQTGAEMRKFADLTSDVVFVTTYDKGASAVKNKIFSNSAQGSFDVTWSISDPLRPIGSVAVQGTALFLPLKVEDQYDVVSRTIRNVYIDQSGGGLSHSLEHHMLPDPMTGLPTLQYLGGTFIVPMLRINGGGGLSFMCAGNAEITGDVTINGNLDVVGGMKNFRINHPLDPENKYLIHSCVESPDMMNIYNGNITTDEQGFAQVQLPDYFEALNENFRYQLTCIGQFAQAIISEEVSDNHFTIRTDKPNVEVSWQVTGVRHDEAAMRYRVPIEGEK